jgi:hypothetical protein
LLTIRMPACNDAGIASNCNQTAACWQQHVLDENGKLPSRCSPSHPAKRRDRALYRYMLSRCSGTSHWLTISSTGTRITSYVCQHVSVHASVCTCMRTAAQQSCWLLIGAPSRAGSPVDVRANFCPITKMPIMRG